MYCFGHGIKPHLVSKDKFPLESGNKEEFKDFVFPEMFQFAK